MHTLTGRQFRLNTARTQPRRALRWAAHRAPAPLPPVQSWLASQYSGLAVRYPAGPGEHPLTGRRLPRGQVMLGNGSVCRLYELFRQGRFVLLADGTGGGNGAGGLPRGAALVRPRLTRTGPGRYGPAPGPVWTGPGLVWTGLGGTRPAQAGVACARRTWPRTTRSYPPQ